MQRPDIQSIAAKWIQLFRIQDRIITVAYVPNLINPVTGDMVYALMSVENSDEGRFRIEVQDPSTWPPGSALQPTQQTIENAVRHECIHIRVRDFANGDVLAEERATWAISNAFDAIADGDIPNVAAMVVTQLARKTQTLSQFAANVRAMAAQPAATRQQAKGQAMDAQAVIAALKEADGEAALKILGDYVAEQLGGANGPPSVQDPNAPPMGADAGNDQKDKPMPDQNMMRAMNADLAEVRAMKAELAQCLAIARPNAKTELVRSMRSDGFDVKPHQEKLVLDAKTIEEAQTLVRGMRATLPTTNPKPPALPPNGSTNGLTRSQSVTYNRMIAAGNEKGAETYRAECVRLNDTKKGGAQ